MPRSIGVKFVLSPEEYASAARHQMLRHPVGVGVGCVGLLAMLAPLLMLAGVRMSSYVALTCVLGGAAFIYFFFVSAPRDVYRKLNPATRDLEQSFLFTEEGVDARLRTGEAKLDWKMWMKFRESDRYFFLFQAQEQFTVLPKRAFAGAEDVDAFRELLKRKFPASS